MGTVHQQVMSVAQCLQTDGRRRLRNLPSMTGDYRCEHLYEACWGLNGDARFP